MAEENDNDDIGGNSISKSSSLSMSMSQEEEEEEEEEKNAEQIVAAKEEMIEASTSPIRTAASHTISSSSSSNGMQHNGDEKRPSMESPSPSPSVSGSHVMQDSPSIHGSVSTSSHSQSNSQSHSQSTSNYTMSSTSTSSQAAPPNYCSDLINFFRSPRQPLKSPQQLQEERRQRRRQRRRKRQRQHPPMSTGRIYSVQRQMQSLIRLQAWWRKCLAQQHFRTMQTCHSLLRQLQLQSRGNYAYRELQNAMFALQRKTEQQLQQPPRPNFERQKSLLSAWHDSLTPPSPQKQRQQFDTKQQPEIVRDDTMSENDEQDDVIWQHAPLAKHTELKSLPQSPRQRHYQRQFQHHARQKKPTRELLALEAIYALQLALDNTSSSGTAKTPILFTRQELLSPHKEVLLQRQQEEELAKQQQQQQEPSRIEPQPPLKQDRIAPPQLLLALPDLSGKASPPAILEGEEEVEDPLRQPEGEPRSNYHDIIAENDNDSQQTIPQNYSFGNPQDDAEAEDVDALLQLSSELVRATSSSPQQQQVRSKSNSISYSTNSSIDHDLVDELEIESQASEEEIILTASTNVTDHDQDGQETVGENEDKDETIFVTPNNNIDDKVTTPSTGYYGGFLRFLGYGGKPASDAEEEEASVSFQGSDEEVDGDLDDIDDKPAIPTTSPGNDVPLGDLVAEEEQEEASQNSSVNVTPPHSPLVVKKQQLPSATSPPLKSDSDQPFQAHVVTPSPTSSSTSRRYSSPEIVQPVPQASQSSDAIVEEEFASPLPLQGHQASMKPSASLHFVPTKAYSTEQIDAVCKIQAWWRLCMEQKQWETLRVCSTILQTVRYVSQPISAFPVNSGSISHAETGINSNQGDNNSQRNPDTNEYSYQDLQHAIQWLQAKPHRQLSVRRYLQDSLKQELAVSAIQRWYRRHSWQMALERERNASKEQSHVSNERYLAAMEIQDWWRSLDLEEYYSLQKRQIYLEQRKIRQASIQRQLALKEREQAQRDGAACVLQGWWRHLHMLRVLAQAHKIQDSWESSSSDSESNLAEEELELVHEGMEVAAIADDVSSIASDDVDVAPVVELELTLRASDQKQYGSASKIQSVLRGYQTRRHYCESQRVRFVSSIVIQAVWRGARQRIVYLEKQAALIKMQSLFRGNLGRARFQMILQSTAHSVAVVVLQAFWRGALTKQKYRREKAAIIVVQSFVRTYQERKSFEQLLISKIGAAIVFQSLWRGIQRRRTYGQERAAIIQLQSAYRGYLARGELQEILFMRCTSAAILVQCFWRRYVTREQYKHVRAAIVLLQSKVRAFQARRAYRLRVSSRLSAAVAIQSYFRRSNAESSYSRKRRSVIKLQTFFRGRQASRQVRIRMLRQNVRELATSGRRAATVIQATWRRHYQTSYHLRLRDSAVVLQSRVRQFLASSMMARLLAEKSAAETIQARFRGYHSHKRWKMLRGMTVRCQAWWRCHDAKVQYARQQNASVSLQCWSRQNLARSNIKALLQHKKDDKESRRRICLLQAAVCIQRHVRGSNARNRIDLDKSSAVTIQKGWRIFAAKCAFKYRQAAVILQSSVRKTQAIDFVHELRAERRATHSASVIQTCWRRHMAARSYNQLRHATIKLQSATRRLQAANITKTRRSKQRLLRLHNAIRIQACWRGHKASESFHSIRHAIISLQSGVRKHQAINFRQRNISATRIQGRWRGYKAGRYNETQEAIVLLQTAIRRYLATRLVNEILIMEKLEIDKSHHAAVRLQTWIRETFGRRQFHLQRSAAIILQSFQRSQTARSHYRKLRSASLLLQCLHRRRISLDHVERIKDQHAFYQKRLSAAVAVQSWWRYVTSMSLFSKHKNACIKIQCFARQRFAVDACAHLRHHQRFLQCQRQSELALASTSIQRVVRGHQARLVRKRSLDAAKYIQYWLATRMSLAQDMRAVRSSIQIQACWRKYAVRAKQQKEQIATVTIQARARRHFAKRKVDSHLAAVVRLQSLRKSRYYARRYILQRRGFVRLQAVTRGGIERKRLLAYRDASIHIQSFYRMITVKRDYQAKLVSANTIQAAYRSFFARRSVACEFLRLEQEAAVRIQAIFRMGRCSNDFHLSRQHCLKVQSFIRAAMARREYTNAKNSISTIQLVWRRHTWREVSVRRRRAAVTLQSVCRRFVRRRKFLKACDSVLLLEAFARRNLVRSDYLNQRASCVALQASVRQYLGTKRFKAIKSAIVVIQSRQRMHQNCRAYNKKKFSCILLQSLWRKKSDSWRFMSARSAVISIQAFWRHFETQKLLSKAKVSAIVIQTAFRGASSRHLMVERSRLILILQALWRGRVVKKRFSEKRAAATTIQSAWRWYLLNCRIREVGKRENLRIVLVQSYARSFVARRLVAKRKKSAVLLKSWMMMIGPRSEFRRLRRSVVSLQAVQRLNIARSSYTLCRDSISRIQALSRMSSCRNRFQLIRKLALFVEKSYRKHRAVVTFQSMRAASVKVQSLFRGHLVRQELMSKLHAANVISQALRQWQCKKARGLAAVEAIIVIQRYARAYMAHRQYSKIKKSLTMIQSVGRMFCAQNDIRRRQKAAVAQRQKDAAIQIQSFCKARIALVNYSNTIRAVTKLQSIIRMVLAEISYWRSCRACIVIQSNMRSKTEEKRYRRILQATRYIQCVWRFHHIRQRFQKKICHSAALIQARYRESVTRRSYCAARSSAAVIQRAFRGYLTRRHLDCASFAASIIQHGWLRYRRRNLLAREREINRKIIRIQSHLRALIVRQRYRSRKQASVTIQSVVRMHLALLFFRRVQNGCIRIQRVARGVASRQRLRTWAACAIHLQSFYRMRRAHLGFRRKTHAARTIQRFIQLKPGPRFCGSRGRSLVRLQSLFRRKYQQRRFEIILSSAIIIQRCYRGFRACKLANARDRAASLIQARVRRKMAQQDMLLQSMASILVQTHVRRFLARRRLLAKIDGVIAVQSCFRGWLTMNDFAGKKRAAECIQRFVRRNAAITESQRRCSVTIQNTWRRRQSMTKYLRQQSCSKIIQKNYRAHKLKRDFIVITSAIVFLQSLTRRRISQKRYKIRVDKICLLQRWWRRNRLRILKQERESACLSAIVILQSGFRGYKARKQQRRRHLQIVVIQSHFRVFMCVRNYSACLKKVLLLQTWFRQVATRTRFLGMRDAAILLQAYSRRNITQHRLSASGMRAMVVQKFFRSFTARRHFLDCRRASTLLQSSWRKYRVLKTVKAKERAARLLQRAYRVYIERRLKGGALQNEAATRIQSLVRAAQLKDHFAECRTSAGKIQVAFLSWKCEQSLVHLECSSALLKHSILGHLEQSAALFALKHSNHLKLLSVEFVGLQRQTRLSEIVRRTVSWYGALRNIRELATVIIQRSVRLHQVLRHDVLGARKRACSTIDQAAWSWVPRVKFLRRRRSALVLQSFMRRAEAATLAVARRNAALKITRYTRAALSRRRLLSRIALLKRQNESLVAIQSTARQFLVRRQWPLYRMRESSVKIQNAYRMYVARTKFHKQRNHAVVIQCLMRRHVAVRAAAKIRAEEDSAVQIQSIVRMLLAKRARLLTAKTKAAAILLQSVYRKHVCLLAANARLSAAATINRNAALAVSRRSFRKALLNHQSASLIQSKARQFLVRKKGLVNVKLHAIIAIQKIMRGFIARALYVYQQQCIATIQTWSRGWLARAAATKRRFAAIVLQRNLLPLVAAYRWKKARRVLHSQQVHAVVTIQRAWRGFVARAIYSCLHYEVTTIQASLRMMLARHTFKRQRLAATKIARVVRRYRGVKELASKQVLTAASNAAEAEVQSLLQGDASALEHAGICLRRLVSQVTQFKFMAEQENKELAEALDKFHFVQDYYG